MTKISLPRALFLVILTLALVPAQLSAQVTPADEHQFLIAKLAAQEGDNSTAIRILGSLIEKQPEDAILRFERASAYLGDRRNAEAEEDLRVAVRVDPSLGDAQKLLGRLLLDRSRGRKELVAEAVEHLEAAFKMAPDDLGTGLMVSQLMLSLDREKEAEAIAGQLVESAPDNRAVNYHYAQILTKLGRADESVAYLERVIAQDPTYRPAVFQLAEIYQEKGDWLAAANVIAPIIDQDPLDLELQRRQGYFFLRAGEAERARERFLAILAVDEFDSRSKFLLAESLNDLRRYAEAEPLYMEVLASIPDDPEVLLSFGLNQILLKKLDSARTTFNRLLAVADLPDGLALIAKTQLAAIDHQRGEFDSALERSTAVLQDSIRLNTQALNIALDVLQKKNRYEDAITLLKPLSQKYSENPIVWARLVEFLHRNGETDKAMRLANEHAALGVVDALAVAQGLSQAEAWNEALQILMPVAEKNPDNLDVMFQVGAMLERSGDKAASESQFLRLLEKNPDHAASLNYLGYMWAERGVNLERAEDMIQRAVDQDPDNGAYVDSLGWVYYRLGKLDLAKRHLTEAAQLIPGDATIQEHLGDVLVDLGEVDRALEIYKAALELSPADEDALRGKISALEKRIAEKPKDR